MMSCNYDDYSLQMTVLQEGDEGFKEGDEVILLTLSDELFRLPSTDYTATLSRIEDVSDIHYKIDPVGGDMWEVDEFAEVAVVDEDEFGEMDKSEKFEAYLLWFVNHCISLVGGAAGEGNMEALAMMEVSIITLNIDHHPGPGEHRLQSVQRRLWLRLRLRGWLYVL